MPGTVMVADITPGAGGTGGQYSGPYNYTTLGDTVFFNASDGVTGLELWKTDGTAAGTALVKDIHPTDWSIPSGLTPLGGTLLFSAADVDVPPFRNRELWKSDGTAAGTVQIKDINPGVPESIPSDFVRLGDVVLFAAPRRRDGYRVVEDRRHHGGHRSVAGYQPRRSDDCPAFVPGSSCPVDLAAIGDAVYFAADDGALGFELWTSDGTEDGTVLVKDINPGIGGSLPLFYTPLGDEFFFGADHATYACRPLQC